MMMMMSALLPGRPCWCGDCGRDPGAARPWGQGHLQHEGVCWYRSVVWQRVLGWWGLGRFYCHPVTFVGWQGC